MLMVPRPVACTVLDVAAASSTFHVRRGRAVSGAQVMYATSTLGLLTEDKTMKTSTKLAGDFDVIKVTAKRH